MDWIINFTKSEGFGIIIITSLFINFALLIYNLVKTINLNKKYQEFMKRLGTGENFEEMLSKYMKNVLNVVEESASLRKYCKELEENLHKCVQKVGMVRYTAFQNTGSDLCFALALLDFEDNGVVINGIYSRDNTTTTYAKPIEKGVSKYKLAKEEEDALNLAKHNGYKYYMEV